MVKNKHTFVSQMFNSLPDAILKFFTFVLKANESNLFKGGVSLKCKKIKSNKIFAHQKLMFVDEEHMYVVATINFFFFFTIWFGTPF